MQTKRKDSKNRVLKEGENQRKNGTYEYKWRDRRGKRHSLYAKTLEELRDKELSVTRDLLDGIRTEKKSLTINDLYQLWKQLKRGLKDNTFENYMYMYEQYVKDDFGEMKIIDLRRSDVRAFYNTLADERHLRASTIDCVHTVLHQVLDIAVEDDCIRFNPADKALKELRKAHCCDSEKRRALTAEEQALFEEFLLKSDEYARWYPIFYIMLWTGMRVGEITGLRWCDIDLENGLIEINHTLVYYSKRNKDGCVFAINTPKTKAGNRTIPMLPKVKEAFLMEKQFQQDLGISCTATIDGYGDFIFVNRFGGVHQYGTLNKALTRIIRDCNYQILDGQSGKKSPLLLPKFSNHSLRHTFATRMCEAGVNVKAMQDILGHHDVQTTMDIYAEATSRLKEKTMNDLAAFFAGYYAA